MIHVSLRSVARYSAQAMLAASLLAVPFTALAQDDPSAAPPMQSAPMAATPMPIHMHHGKHNPMMKELKQLNLSDDQKAQIKAIHEKFMADHPTKGSATKSDYKAMAEQIKAVLTPEQREKLKQMHAMHKNMHQHPSQMPTVAP